MIVIDASVWVSYFVRQDTHHAVTHRWLRDKLAGGVPLVAPILLLAEIGGAITRRLDRPELGERVIDQLLAIPTLRLVNVDHALGIQAARIAAGYRLRGADVMYVAVADRLHIPLVSWDREQLQRANDLITAHTPAQD